MNTNSLLPAQPVLARRKLSSRGYTLMELIVVLGVLAFIGVLAGAYAPDIVTNASDRQKAQVSGKVNESLLSAAAAGISISDGGSPPGINSASVDTLLTSLTGGQVTSPLTGPLVFRPRPNPLAYRIADSVSGVPQIEPIRGQPGVPAFLED